MTDPTDTPDDALPADGRRDAGTDRDATARALDAGERVLAARIATTAPADGPSAALDARILALAHAPMAATTPSAPPAAAIPGNAAAPVAMTSTATPAPRPHATGARRPRRRRWPAMAGIAATLTLAFGLAWQMRPLDQAPIEASEALRAPTAKARGASGPRVDDSADTAAASAAQGIVPEAPSRPSELLPQAAAPARIARRDRAPQADAERSGSARAAPAPPPAPAPPQPIAAEPAPAAATPSASAPAAPIVFDTPSPMDTPSPAAPPAPAAPSTADTAEAAERARDRVSTRAALGATAAAKAKAEAEAEARSEQDRIDPSRTAFGTAGDQPIDDQPPASADSPAIRDAWLGRVRQLLADGHLDDAVASLREYRRRHPDAPIPDDLRALLPAD